MRKAGMIRTGDDGALEALWARLSSLKMSPDTLTLVKAREWEAELERALASPSRADGETGSK
jgi:hypothetical protein